MITFDSKTQTVSMDLVDLEHCGFSHEDYESELFLAGLDPNGKDIAWPKTLVVNFKGGAVVVGRLEEEMCNKQSPNTEGGEI